MTADEVHDKHGFIALLAQMREELKFDSDGWQNIKLDDFLEAMSAWVNDWQRPADTNPWTHAAKLIVAASMYE
ncbi:hypothetical protein [Sinorhizobium sp. RAC02]|uniref:DUF7660 family protein n=1 Tax=Sinorhizobium sp. RAC02 TaxID=1842534 RepID=UPI00083CDD6D|nr:hypothetical protein [Sinorhizobium sp. RAC02]AOF89125.1 hypothetical protein BSY16_2276 [Sinorhizobium sp. RAC02]